MSKILVCYFSATGTTREVAKKISAILDSDLFEIIPSIKYTEDDLNWDDSKSRTTIEMNDSTIRPKIVNKLSNIDDYDTIILGFPVWWYTAPRIVNTFLEENDFSNKKIYVFVTSGSSGSDTSFNDLKNTYGNLNFISSRRFTNNTNDFEIINWIK